MARLGTRAGPDPAFPNSRQTQCAHRFLFLPDLVSAWWSGANVATLYYIAITSALLRRVPSMRGTYVHTHTYGLTASRDLRRQLTRALAEHAILCSTLISHQVVVGHTRNGCRGQAPAFQCQL